MALKKPITQGPNINTYTKPLLLLLTRLFDAIAKKERTEEKNYMKNTKHEKHSKEM